ncbi:ABC transporter permease subunit [Streptomyces sp. DSM 44915]|uniref:ABC transporter permease subunit n=1 Tax=Streptomyces chisholmiae TaxID=3075540 RepID=A0ABU2JQG6_9ACTN|nr:ABC transporter permease subunit [Streptomyces sp. DSM 44915]MDT0267157.1 ABC transporter permease subunit [Streptomyces sp. DSM 44915]
MYNHTVARLTYRALLGRRRVLILIALPALLLAISVAVRVLSGSDDAAAVDILGGFALAAMVPLIGVVAGTGAIAPEIDDGSIVYLLAKPLPRRTIILTKLIVAVSVTIAFTTAPILVAGLILNGNGLGIASGYTVAAGAAAVAYGALFLLLGTISRNAVVIGLIYALVWEALLGNVLPGVRTLSVQQWSLSLAEGIAESGAGVTSDVALPLALVLLVSATVLGTWYAIRRLTALTVTGDG